MDVGRVCVPGDIVGSTTDCLKLGPGLKVDDKGNIACYRAGLLRGREGKVYWIDCNNKRYVPASNERVLGIISQTQRLYRVDIAAHCTASLSELAFEGATKKNKPNLQVGDVVYCRLSSASPDVEPEVTCVDKSGKANGLGPLKESENAFMFTCSLGLCRKLFQTKPSVLETLKERGFKFEVVPGMNGRVWVDSTHLYHTIAIANAITLSEFMTDNEIHEAVQKIGDTVMS